MEPKNSSPHSQDPAICPYPEPDQSSPCPSPNLWKIHFNIILTSMPKSYKFSPSLRLLHQNFTCVSHICVTCPSIQFFFILSPKLHLVGNTGHKFLAMLYFPPSCHLAPLRPPRYLLHDPSNNNNNISTDCTSLTYRNCRSRIQIPRSIADPQTPQHRIQVHNTNI